MKVAIDQLYKEAYGKYGIGAFNVFNAEQVHGVFRGAKKCTSPVIIQLTPVARNYMQPEFLQGMLEAAEKIYPEVVFTVHLDHGTIVHCLSAIETGYYNSVMIDASHEPFQENVRITKGIVKAAHARGIAVEAELGVLSGVEDDLSIDAKHALCTDPQQAREFIEATQCDSLAIAIGTSHGAYKFSGSQKLQLHILQEIQHLVPGFPLVLHGASSVPMEEVARINKAGGRISEDAKGTDEKELLQAIKLGVCKINIATDMRLIWTRIHREFFMNSPEKFDMVVPGKEYMDALETFVAQKCMALKPNF
jgi:fructose-bisphosphate aldolase, class II